MRALKRFFRSKTEEPTLTSDLSLKLCYLQPMYWFGTLSLGFSAVFAAFFQGALALVKCLGGFYKNLILFLIEH